MKTLLPLSIILVMLSACESDTSSPAETNNNTDAVSPYSKLEIGNYWVYQGYGVNPDGDMNILSRKDSTVVESDTIIDGETYFVLTTYPLNTGQNSSSRMLRDSGDDVVLPDGTIDYTLNLDGSELSSYTYDENQINYTTRNYMNSEIVQESTPAGDFDCIERTTEITTTVESVQEDYPKYDYTRYVCGIGKVSYKHSYFSGPSALLYLLEDYEVQD